MKFLPSINFKIILTVHVHAITFTILFLPFFGSCLGVLVLMCDFFPITKVSGESAWPVDGASAAAFVLGVFGYT